MLCHTDGMSTRLTFVQRAEPGDVFSQTAWHSQIGKEIPFNVGERRGRCKLIAAQVAEDGRSAQLTVETDEILHELDPALYWQLPGMSIGFSPIPAEPLPPTDLDALRRLGRRHQRLRADLDALRPELTEQIRAAATAGVPQVEIVKATGYTRDRVRTIVAGRTR